MIFKPIILGIGSNLGDRLKNLEKSILDLQNYFKIHHISSIYETSAIGPHQNNFLNLVISGEARLPPLELLSHIKKTESLIGRVPTFLWGPRIIDIDILFFEKQFFSLPELTIPHKEIKNRRFVLEPLLEIAGNLPINNLSLLFYLNQNLGQTCEKTTYTFPDSISLP